MKIKNLNKNNNNCYRVEAHCLLDWIHDSKKKN